MRTVVPKVGDNEGSPLPPTHTESHTTFLVVLKLMKRFLASNASVAIVDNVS